MKYLVDTNVWLELLLGQEKSDVAEKFFDTVPTENLFISDFSLHSIGVILSCYKKYSSFKTFLDDLFINGQIELLTLDFVDLHNVVSNIQKINLDFDDSYQHSVAKKYGLVIVTFDKDFSAKGIAKNSPEEVIQSLHK